MNLPLCEYLGYPIRVLNNDDTQGFFLILFAISWGRWTGDHLQQEFSKIRYRLDRKVWFMTPQKKKKKKKKKKKNH